MAAFRWGVNKAGIYAVCGSVGKVSGEGWRGVVETKCNGCPVSKAGWVGMRAGANGESGMGAKCA